MDCKTKTGNSLFGFLKALDFHAMSIARSSNGRAALVRRHTAESEPGEGCHDRGVGDQPALLDLI